MTTQRIILGDCLDVFASERDVPAFCSDVPGLVSLQGFMGRKWDRAQQSFGALAPMLPPRSKAHERELLHERDFTQYWAIRYAMAYDIADQHAVNIVWTLPRTSYLTANALRAAGWTIKDNLVHLFGSGWMKSKRTNDDGERVPNALAPGQEGWILATKGKPDLDIDACRVPRGERDLRVTAEHDYKGATYGDRKGCKAAGKTSEGSLPKNAVLSHCEGCVRVGSKRVKGTSPKDNRGKPGNYRLMATGSDNGNIRDDVWEGFGETESVPAFHCLAGCVCGARSKWDPEQQLPRCPCGETWRWLCPVAEINGQSGKLETSGTAKLGKPIRHTPTGNETAYGTRTDSIGYGYAESGGASRFFNTFKYLSKCSPSERHAGCENLYWKADKKDPFGFVQVTHEEWERLETTGEHLACLDTQARRERTGKAQGNVHPTVKSYRLTHWLHLLSGAPRILDMTAGSGTGMYTAYLDGIEWLGAEICPQAIVIAEARLAFWKGLSFDARRAFLEDDVVPEPIATKTNQRSLFE